MCLSLIYEGSELRKNVKIPNFIKLKLGPESFVTGPISLPIEVRAFIFGIYIL